MVEKVAELHKKVTEHLKKMNTKYKTEAGQHRKFKEFKEGDLVMVHLYKTRFPATSYNKLHPWKLGPFRVLNNYGNNAYKIEVLSDVHIT